MTTEIGFVYGLILIVAALMVSNKVRFDAIALLVVIALTLSEILSVKEALSGFSNPVVILVGALLIIGEMLERTGVARMVGDRILKSGGDNEVYLLLLIMLGAGLLGSIMSSTAIVAIFIPVVMRIAAKTNSNPSRMLMPMAYAALVSGMLTLIASPPNLVISQELVSSGYKALGFFSFSLIGLAVLIGLVIYMLLVGRHMLAAGEVSGQVTGRSIYQLWEDFKTDENFFNFRLPSGCALTNHSLASAKIDSRYNVRVLGVERRQRHTKEYIAAPGRNFVMTSGDRLLVYGHPEAIDKLAKEQQMSATPISERDRRWLWEMGGAEVMIHPDSRLIGDSIKKIGFRTSHNLHVLGVRRHQKPLENFREVELQAADCLFLVGSWKKLRQLQTFNHDFIPIEISAEHADVVPSYRRMPIALGILVGMVALSILDLIPLVTSVMIAAMLAVASRCLSAEDAYRSIHWSSLVLIAGMLPLADALNRTGGTELLVNGVMQQIGDVGPYVMLSIIFWLTAIIGLILSNTASAVLVAPVAISIAEALSVSPYPFAIAVLIGASAAFATPVSTPVVTLVVEPGRYRFFDFVKLGVPMQVITYVVVVVFAPILFPF